MTLQQTWITILVMALGTMFTRFITFVVFPPNSKPPVFVEYLGKVLPTAAIALLVVYALKDVQLTSQPHGLPEIIAIIAIVLVHRWKRNTLISILTGTVIYMFLVQFVFI